jgi:hypothetical protein
MEESMAARDILSLDEPLAPRLIRILYALALVLITLGVVMGLIQGLRTATRMPPLPPLQMSGQANPNAPQAQPPSVESQLGMRQDRFGRRGFGPRGLEENGLRPGRASPFGMNARRNPGLFGAFLIVRTLVMGFIGLLVVRILAEMALSVLALNRRSEITHSATT